MIKFKAKLEQISSSVWGQVIIVPEKYVQQLLADDSKRIVVKVNNDFTFQAALMPAGKGRYFVNFSKRNAKKNGWIEGQMLDIELSKDKSKYGLPMPEEFQEMLYQDLEGDRLFHALTPGKQRSLLHIIGIPKSQDIRIRKSLIILNHLKSNGGKLDNRKLYQDFKEYKDHDFGF